MKVALFALALVTAACSGDSAPIDTPDPDATCRAPQLAPADDVGDPGGPGTYLFTDAAHIAPGTVADCPDYTSTRCYNTLPPPAPSIRRAFVRPLLTNPQSQAEPDTARAKPFSWTPQSPSQTFVLPTHRTTTDGRLATVPNHPAFMLLSPENLDYGMQTSADPDRAVLSRVGYLHHAMMIDPRAGKSRFTGPELVAGQLAGRGRYWDLCTGTGKDQLANPFACTARYTATDPLREGDCYRATTLFSNVSDNNRWELRSSELIVFVPGGKTAPAGDPLGEMWVYPASVVTPGQPLPPFHTYDYGPQIAWVGPGQWDYDWTYARFYERALAECVGATPEPWCRFLDDQRVISPATNYRFFSAPGVSAAWNGHGQGHALLEPATTADGRVLIAHDDTLGIVYAYNALGACRADGFRDFKPISMAYTDPDVATRYGFAASPLRDTQNRPYAPGAPVIGGYPWIDREGDNIMFPAAAGQDGWKATWEHSGALATTSELNRTNSRGVVVIGAWTRGKAVLVDNGLNNTDYTFSAGWIGSPLYDGVFTLPLYDRQTVRVRPAGASLLSSLESVFNHYDALAPISPFDVVWVASSTAQRNAEVVFDEYLDPRALVVAHMNAPLRPTRVNHDYHAGGARFGETVTDDNGFVSAADDGYGFRFEGTPKLQNAATIPSPPTLALHGGAFVPPVAEGGVLGKGVFLDGINDHVRVAGLADVASHYVGLWVDIRAQAWPEQAPHSLYIYPDGSAVRLSRDAIELHGTSGEPSRVPVVVPRGRYTHLGLIVDRSGERPRVRVLVNGDPVGEAELASGFDLGQGDHPFVIGNDGRSGAPAVRAWIDELRVYRLGAHELGGGHVRELACNLALGSLRRTTPDPEVCFADGLRCDQLDLFHDEEIDAEGVGAGLDFPLEAYRTRRCGALVHRNSDPDCARAEVLGLGDRQLQAGVFRPSFADVPFCQTCHQSSADPIRGLRPDALAAGIVPARDDPRRQPMMWPRHLFGQVPTRAGAPLAPFDAMTTTYLDDIFLGSSPTTPPSRVRPE